MATKNTAKEAVETVETTADAVEVKETPKAPERKQRVQIDPNTMIPVKNVTNGTLTYVSHRGGFEARWGAYGDVEYIPFSELVTMKSGQSRFLFEPWLMIDEENDADVIEQLGLKRTYDNVIPADQMASFFRLPATEIEARLKKAPQGTRQTVAQYARELVQSGQLDSMRIIKTLERELKVDLLIVQEDSDAE